MNEKATVRLARWSRICGLPAAIALGCLVTALEPAQAQEQEPGRIVGTITSAVTGGPLAAAQVFIVDTRIGTLSRENGEYVLINVPAGTHRIRAVLIGWGSVTQDVTVPAGGAVTVDFQLREAPIEMEAIVVTGTPGEARRREIGHDISQISLADVQNALPANVHDILQGQCLSFNSSR